MDSSTSTTTKPLYRAIQIAWFVVGITEILLLFRFFLKLFVANTQAGFTRFIYMMTDGLTFPFTSVFKSNQIEGSVFEWTTLLAMFVYAVLAWGIVKLFFMSKTISTQEAAIELNK